MSWVHSTRKSWCLGCILREKADGFRLYVYHINDKTTEIRSSSFSYASAWFLTLDRTFVLLLAPMSWRESKNIEDFADHAFRVDVCEKWRPTWNPIYSEVQSMKILKVCFDFLRCTIVASNTRFEWSQPFCTSLKTRPLSLRRAIHSIVSPTTLQLQKTILPIYFERPGPWFSSHTTTIKLISANHHSFVRLLELEFIYGAFYPEVIQHTAPLS